MRLHHALWASTCLLVGSAAASPNDQPASTWTKVPSFSRRNVMYSNSTSTITPITKVLPPIIIVTPTTTSTTETCISLKPDEPSRVYYILRTETITWTAAPELYTPPYPELHVPDYCSEPRQTVAPTAELTLTAPSKSIPPGDDDTTTWAVPTWPAKSSEWLASRQTITIFTVDKNPAVIYSSVTAPDYIQSNIAGRPRPGPAGGSASAADKGHALKPNPHDGGTEVPQRGESRLGSAPPAEGTGGVPEGGGISQPGQGQANPAKPSPRPTFTVSAGGNQVIINDSTFESLGPSKTSTVTVGQGTFTIKPTAVEGEGATITKPIPQGPGLIAAKPTSDTLDGLPVVISGSEAVIGGTTIEIPRVGTTTVIGGKAVSVGRDAVVVGDHSITFSAVDSGPSLVAGGTTVEAIGRSIVVIHSTTITYGPGIPGTSQVIDGETISVGPDGVGVHGTKMGGPAADPTSTVTDIVGGLTITAIGPSAVALDGNTITLGPESSRVTVVVHGQTVTIGSSEIVLSFKTCTFPGASVVVTTIVPPEASAANHPIETGARTTSTSEGQGEEGGAEDADSGAAFVGSSTALGPVGVCIAIGVLLWV